MFCNSLTIAKSELGVSLHTSMLPTSKLPKPLLYVNQVHLIINSWLPCNLLIPIKKVVLYKLSQKCMECCENFLFHTTAIKLRLFLQCRLKKILFVKVSCQVLHSLHINDFVMLLCSSSCPNKWGHIVILTVDLAVALVILI